MRRQKGSREIERNERNVAQTLYIEIPVSHWIESCRAYRNFLDGSSSCRAAIEIESQESRWIEIAITAIEKRSSRGSIDSLAVERYQEAVEIA